MMRSPLICRDMVSSKPSVADRHGMAFTSSRSLTCPLLLLEVTRRVPFDAVFHGVPAVWDVCDVVKSQDTTGFSHIITLPDSLFAI